jgi:hypothetical protein
MGDGELILVPDALRAHSCEALLHAIKAALPWQNSLYPRKIKTALSCLCVNSVVGLAAHLLVLFAQALHRFAGHIHALLAELVAFFGLKKIRCGAYEGESPDLVSHVKCFF